MERDLEAAKKRLNDVYIEDAGLRMNRSVIAINRKKNMASDKITMG